MVIEKDALVKSFERRYDFVSARAVYTASLESTGLKDKDSFSADEIASICAYLQGKSNTADLVEHLQKQLSGDAPKPAAKKAEEKPAEKKAEEKPAENKPAENKPAEKKPAAKKPAAKKPAAKKPAPKGKGD